MRSEGRHSRQTVLPEIGEEGQQALAKSTVLVVGCGALGTHSAELLVRAGVGTVQIVDRDLVETSNLQRQVLFTQQDADARLPKATAAAAHLTRIDAAVAVQPFIVDLTPDNVMDFVENVSIVVDGTDNLETRYLVNDACVRRQIPWVYGGVIGTEGMAMAVVPQRGPCLRCLFPDPPSPGSLPTCDTVGVLNTAPALISAMQVSAAFRILVGDGAVAGDLVAAELWDLSFRKLHVEIDPECPCCGQRDFAFLESRHSTAATRICGRNAVQITAAAAAGISVAGLRDRLSSMSTVVERGQVLEAHLDEGLVLLLFPDGRTIVEGTDDATVARAIFSRYIGS